jgi:hypothetical protein
MYFVKSTFMLIVMTISVCLSSPLLAKTLYKIVHPDGIVTYTDSPQPGAIKVTLSPVNVAETSGGGSNGNNQSDARAKISITQPADGSTVVNSNGYVTVSADMQPMGEGSFQLMVDGLPIHRLTPISR